MAEAQLLRNQTSQEAVREEYNDHSSLKNFQNSLLCSTIYQLNYSGSKKASVGLTYDHHTQRYKPVVQLQNSYYSRGLNFDTESWEELQFKIDEISTYFNSSSGNLCIQQQERIKLSKIDIILTTSYGMKSVMFCQRNPDTENSVYVHKKKRILTPSITIQKKTFEGLKSVIICVNERCRRLERVLSEINSCKDLIVYELEKFLTLYDFQNTNSSQIVRDTVFEKRNFIKENVLRNLNSQNSVFIQHYFEIVFLEIVILHHNILHDEVYNIFCSNDAQKI